MFDQLDSFIIRYDELSELLSDPDVISDTKRFMELTKEESNLRPKVETFKRYQQVVEEIGDTEEMLGEGLDSEMAEMAKEELASLKKEKVELEEKIKCLDKMTDEEIVMQIKEKHDDVALDYIIKKYRNLVRVKARAYFLIGADREDIIQEGMIGLYKGVRDFRSDKLSSFRAFAEMCITRQIITAVKTATRQKHIPLNSYVSLNKPIYDEESDRTLLDIISGSVVIDPEEMMIHREEFLDIEDKMEKLLSDLEWKVLIAYLDGKSYQEIAVELHRHVKSIDNALQRVKRKLEKYVDGHGNIDIKGSMSDFGSVGKYLRDMY